MSITLYFCLGLFYLIVFCIVLFFFNRNEIKDVKISARWLISIFIIKALAGITYGYIYSHYYTISDSWDYFRESLIEYNNLLNKPSAFISIGTDKNTITEIFSTANNAFWNNIGNNIVIKLLAVLNVFSFGNYYISSILFNIFSYVGLYLIYKVAASHFKENKLLLFLLIFLFPSNLFWSSGIAKESLIVFFSGVLIYKLNKIISAGNHSAKNIFTALFSFAGIILMRSATALLFIPAIIGWYFSNRAEHKKYLAYIISYTFFIILFFLSALFKSSFNMPLNFAQKQHDFLKLKASTTLPLTPLQPTIKSYITVFPQALNHVFLRPYVTEISSPFHLLAFIENTIIIIIVIYCIVFWKKKIVFILKSPFCLFVLFLSLSGFILVGYTVPFPGAITKYKALYAVLFLIPFFANFKKSNILNK